MHTGVLLNSSPLYGDLLLSLTTHDPLNSYVLIVGPPIPAEVDGAYKQREAALEAYMQEQGAEAKRGSRRKTATAVAVPAQQ
jgi:hypothetical protein